MRKRSFSKRRPATVHRLQSQPAPVNEALIILARESRGLTQQELANALGLSQAHLSKMEVGIQRVSDELVRRLSHVLGYPESFFRQAEDVYGPGVTQLFHRKRYRVPATQLRRIHALINIMRIHIKRLLNNVDIGELIIRPMDLEEFAGSPENVARAIRALWRLPSGPIPNVVAVIERAGGIVIPLDFGTSHIDGISEWPPDMPPLFFVNTRAPGDRQRWTLAHELGHIAMHTENPNADMEDQANRFASEFLAPAQDIKPYLHDLTIHKLAQLKPYWKMSMAALLYRAESTGAISHDHARRLWMQFSRRGWRKQEPPELALPVEQPSLLRQLFDVHKSHLNFTIRDFAEMFCLSEDETRSMYFGGPIPLRAR